MTNKNRSGKRTVIDLTKDMPCTIAIVWKTKEVIDLTGEIDEKKTFIDVTNEKGEEEKGMENEESQEIEALAFERHHKEHKADK